MAETYGRVSSSRQAVASFWSVFKHLLLLVALLGYALFGAWLFSLLERHPELQRRLRRTEELDRLKSSLLSSLHEEIFLRGVKITHAERLHRHREARRRLDEYEEELLGVRPSLNATNWDTYGAMFFACSLFTTIGYGTYTPETTAGRIATMAYGLFGVPLFLLFVFDFGWLLFVFYRKLASLCCRCFSQRHYQWEEINQLKPRFAQPVKSARAVDLPLTVILVVLVLWLFVSAALVHAWEGWTFFTSLYFVFFSTWTIGFNEPALTKHNWALLVYVLVTVALCFLVSCVLVVRSKLFLLFKCLLQQIDCEFRLAQEENMQERMTTIGCKQGVCELTSRQPWPSRLLASLFSENERALLQKHWLDRSRLRSRGCQTGIFEVVGGESQFRALKMVQFRSEKDPEATSLGSYVTAYGYLPGNLSDDQSDSTPIIRVRPKSPSSLFGRDKYAYANSTTSGASNNLIFFPNSMEQSPIRELFDSSLQRLPSPTPPPPETHLLRHTEPITATTANNEIKSPYRAITYSDDEVEPYHPPRRTYLSDSGPEKGSHLKRESFRVFKQPPSPGRNILEDVGNGSAQRLKQNSFGATGSVEYPEGPPSAAVTTLAAEPEPTAQLMRLGTSGSVAVHHSDYPERVLSPALKKSSISQHHNYFPLDAMMSPQNDAQNLLCQQTVEHHQNLVHLDADRGYFSEGAPPPPNSSRRVIFGHETALVGDEQRPAYNSAYCQKRDHSPSINSQPEGGKRLYPFGRPLPDYLLPEVLVEKSSSPQPSA